MHWKQKLISNTRVIRAVTDTTQGKELLKLLDQQFNVSDAVGDTPYETYFNLGQQSVVKYLQLIAAATPEELSALQAAAGTV